MKLEAIILAAGSGNRMLDLTRNRPKCLLPIGNHSLIWFAITGLKKAGINKMTILIPDSYESDIKQYCHKKFNAHKDLYLDFVSVPANSDCGTAESILSIKDKIRGDFIVHSCDSIVHPKALSFLINHYRLYDPMMTMLLSDNSDYFQRRLVPGRKEKEHAMRDIIAIEPLDKLNLTASDEFTANKVVFLHSERDLKKISRLKSKELALHPSLEVHSRLLDTHIYIFKHHLLEFLHKNADKVVLKAEIIPSLVSKQFCKLHTNEVTDHLEDDVNMVSYHKRADYEIELKEKLEFFSPRNVTQNNCFRRIPLSRPTDCHAVVFKDLIAHRVNTIGSFLDTNKDARSIFNMLEAKNIQTYKDSLLGDNSVIGDKCVIKRSSIGNNCKIGERVKLFDCVIMDNVEIDSKCNLNECIIGGNSKIGPKCDMKLTIVGQKQLIAGGRKSNCEIISDDSYVIDLGDPITVDDE